MRSYLWLAVAGAVAATLIGINLIGNGTPPFDVDLMKGCYNSVDGVYQNIKILGGGHLVYDGTAMDVTTVKQKFGTAILPEKELLANDEGLIEIRNGTPLLIPIDKDHMGFSIVGRNGLFVKFRKSNCT